MKQIWQKIMLPILRWWVRSWWKVGLSVWAIVVAAGVMVSMFKTPSVTFNVYMFILALVSILVAIAGLGLYVALREQLRREARKASYMETQMALTYWFNERSYSLVQEYLDGKSPHCGNADYLDKAIELAERANSEYASKLDERQPRYELQICAVKNNLAALLALRKEKHPDRVQDGDAEVAKACIYYILKRIAKYRQYAKEAKWGTTAQEVKEAFHIDIQIEEFY